MVGPAFEIAAGWDRGADVGVDFFVDVLKRRWDGDAVVYRKTETVGLAAAVVGILAQDDDFHLLEWARVERVEDEGWRWIDGFGLILGFHKIRQLFEIGLFKFIL